MIRLSGIQQPRQRNSACSKYISRRMKTLHMPIRNKQIIGLLASKTLPAEISCFPFYCELLKKETAAAETQWTFTVILQGLVPQAKVQVFTLAHGDHIQHSSVHLLWHCVDTGHTKDILELNDFLSHVLLHRYGLLMLQKCCFQKVETPGK